jgi:D-alanyl-lipoteichoic acid acyltransferase DltB (MBOAT superfamily)
LFFNIAYASLWKTRSRVWRPAFNVIATMTLAGLWHGASWPCVLYGTIHGVYMAVEQALGIDAVYEGKLGGKILRTALTFHLLLFSFIVFRSPDMTVAQKYVRGLFAPAWHLGATSLLRPLAIIGIYIMIAPLRKRIEPFNPGDSWLKQGGYALALAVFFMGLAVAGAAGNTFIYFQF